MFIFSLRLDCSLISVTLAKASPMIAISMLRIVICVMKVAEIKRNQTRPLFGELAANSSANAKSPNASRYYMINELVNETVSAST